MPVDDSSKDASPYPERAGRKGKGIFALAFLRHVQRCGVGMECGQAAVNLLQAVILQEDQQHRVARFWNSELVRIVGCREETLIAARQRLIDSGWLHYSKGSKVVCATYWVKVPGGDDQVYLRGAWDSGVEEIDSGKAESKTKRKRAEKRDEYGEKSALKHESSIGEIVCGVANRLAITGSQGRTP